MSGVEFSLLANTLASFIFKHSFVAQRQLCDNRHMVRHRATVDEARIERCERAHAQLGAAHDVIDGKRRLCAKAVECVFCAATKN